MFTVFLFLKLPLEFWKNLQLNTLNKTEHLKRVRRLNGEEDLIRAGEDAATGQGYPSVNKLLPTYHRYLLLGKHLAGSVVLSCR